MQRGAAEAARVSMRPPAGEGRRHLLDDVPHRRVHVLGRQAALESQRDPARSDPTCSTAVSRSWSLSTAPPPFSTETTDATRIGPTPGSANSKLAGDCGSRRTAPRRPGRCSSRIARLHTRAVLAGRASETNPGAPTRHRAAVGGPGSPSSNGRPDARQDAVNHGRGEYVRGECHVNGVESFWAMLKRGHKGRRAGRPIDGERESGYGGR